MSRILLNTTSVKVDNLGFEILANSFKVKMGYGEKETMATLGANGNVVNNVIIKPDTKKSVVSFEIANNSTNQENVDTLFSTTLHTVTPIDPNGDYPPFVDMVLINEPEFNSAGEGVELIFEGPPVKGQ